MQRLSYPRRSLLAQLLPLFPELFESYLGAENHVPNPMAICFLLIDQRRSDIKEDPLYAVHSVLHVHLLCNAVLLYISCRIYVAGTGCIGRSSARQTAIRCRHLGQTMTNSAVLPSGSRS